MKNLYSLTLLFLILSACTNTNQEQKKSVSGGEKKVVEKSYTGELLNRFEQAIENIEWEDSVRVVMKNEVLFIGSSSIRLWKTLQRDFDPIPVINRAFGGSTLPELIYYADRMIFPYQPGLIVLYCGENDIAEGASPEQTFETFKKLDQLIRTNLPETRMIYISMKPSIARWNLWEQYVSTNEMIRKYLDGQNRRLFIDCSAVMLTESGDPDPSVFVEDQLHLNERGYAGWTTLIRPKVEELYSMTNVPATAQ